jgi:hypothetical protein
MLFLLVWPGRMALDAGGKGSRRGCCRLRNGLKAPVLAK